MDNLFFWSSKLVWAVLSPLNLMCTVLVIICFLFWFGVARLAIILLSVLVILLLIATLFPVGGWLLYPLETRFETNPKLPEAIDGIIVLGGAQETESSSQWSQVQLSDSSERNLAFIKLARRYPGAKLVFSGGGTASTAIRFTEADVSRIMFDELGLDTSGIVFEDKSRNTYENVKFSHELIKPQSGQKWLLITSAFHMPRAVGIFCKFNWEVLPYPVDHRTLPDGLFTIEFDLLKHMRNFSVALHEWVGLLVYYLTGKTNTLFPGQCYLK